MLFRTHEMLTSKLKLNFFGTELFFSKTQHFGDGTLVYFLIKYFISYHSLNSTFGQYFFMTGSFFLIKLFWHRLGNTSACKQDLTFFFKLPLCQSPSFFFSPFEYKKLMFWILILFYLTLYILVRYYIIFPQ